MILVDGNHVEGAGGPFQANLELEPSERVELIDINGRLNRELGSDFAQYPRALYVSFHTTAGYLDQSLAERLNHDGEDVQDFISVFQGLFPPDAGYTHDQLHLRTELSDEQRATEPKNADSHLTFMGAGLKNCVSYEQRPGAPVWFVELDGVGEAGSRQRRTTVVGYHGEESVATLRVQVPVSDRGIDAHNLLSPEFGVMEQLEALARQHGVAVGRVDVSLAPEENHAGLTVNEYETLLMKHDLREVLTNPLRFVAEKGKSALKDPRAIPAKTLNYAQFDGVHILNKLMDRMGVRKSVVERIVNRAVAVPVSHFLRMKRGISLPVLQNEDGRSGEIVRGTYQSPILVQWRPAARATRTLEVRLIRFI